LRTTHTRAQATMADITAPATIAEVAQVNQSGFCGLNRLFSFLCSFVPFLSTETTPRVVSDCIFHTTTDFSQKYTKEYFDDLFKLSEKYNPGLMKGNGYDLWEELKSMPLGQEMLITENSDCAVQWKRFVLDQSDTITLEENLQGFVLNGEAPDFRYVEDDPELPNVLLLGDSISMGTWLYFQDWYGSKANIHTAPTNCGPFEKYDDSLDSWLGNQSWDVVQFNVGLHHLARYQEDDFLTFDFKMRSVIDRIHSHSPEAIVVFASTTPSPYDSQDSIPDLQTCIQWFFGEYWMNLLQDIYPEGMISSMNDVARLIASEYGVLVNDRYSVVAPVLKEEQIPCDIHFRDSGYERLALSDWETIGPLVDQIGRTIN